MTLTDNRPHFHGVGPTGSPAERFTSRDPEAFEIPRGREEQWRFTPIRAIREFFEPVTATGTLTGSVVAPTGVSHEIVAMDDPVVGQVLQPADRVSALAFRHAERAFVVRVPTGLELDEPIRLSAVGTPGRSYAHLVVEFGERSRATVVIDYSGSTAVAENVEIVVGAGARASVVNLFGWDAETVHLAAHAIEIGRDATYRHVSVGLGGSLVRLAPTVRFAGPGGRAELLGVNFAGDGQHFESRLFVDHSQPECSSDVLYKNALLGDSARTVWVGDVRIRPAATGTRTYELNRNLLLSAGARADSVPNLEIETGEIAGAGHASATGRFDDLQLFYLQSRGIPAAEAQRLVVRGFFADVVERIGIDELEHRIMTAIEARLGFTPELETTA